MFSKRAKPGRVGPSSEPAPLSETGPARKTPPKVASLIADDITIEGNLRGDGELHIDGTIRGDVSAARLSIGESGKIEGSINAEAAEVRGRVTGSITAKQVRLHASAHVDGDITHEQLTIETGAFFEGRSKRLQRAATSLATSGDVIDISAASGASS